MKHLIVIVFFFCLPFALQAQRPMDRKDIESYRIAFLTQKMDLSPEEAKIFWPIYTDWQKEQVELRKERDEKMISFRKIAEIDDLSDNEVQTLILNDFSMRQRELNLEKRYYLKLKASLPIKIIGKYYRAQEAFKRELLNRYRGGKQ